MTPTRCVTRTGSFVVPVAVVRVTDRLTLAPRSAVDHIQPINSVSVGAPPLRNLVCPFNVLRGSSCRLIAALSEHVCDDQTVWLLWANPTVRSLLATLSDAVLSSRPNLPCLCLLMSDMTPDPDTVDGLLRYQVFLSTKKSSDFMGMCCYLETARCFQVRLQSSGRCWEQQPAQGPVRQAGRPGLFVLHCAHMLGQSLGAHGSYRYRPHLVGAQLLCTPLALLWTLSLPPPPACSLTGLQQGFCGLELHGTSVSSAVCPMSGCLV